MAGICQNCDFTRYHPRAIFNVFQSAKTIRIVQKEHYSDALAKDIQQLASSSNESAKIVALSKLSTYMNRDDSSTDQQLINLFRKYAELDSLKTVREFIEEELYNKVPSSLLRILINENLNLEDSANKNAFGVEAERTRAKANDQLKKNTQMILNCLIHMKIVENIDFSHVTFLSPDTTIARLNDMGTNLAFPGTVMENITFKNVSFNYCTMKSIGFANDSFSSVSFDESWITNVAFTQCKFSGCSFNRFSWYDYNPSWIDCNMKAKSFIPICEADIKVDFFSRCKWSIDTIDAYSDCFKYQKIGSNIERKFASPDSSTIN